MMIRYKFLYHVIIANWSLHLLGNKEPQSKKAKPYEARLHYLFPSGTTWFFAQLHRDINSSLLVSLTHEATRQDQTILRANVTPVKHRQSLTIFFFGLSGCLNNLGLPIRASGNHI